MAGDKGIGARMKAVGRGMAKAENQAASKKIPMKYAEGGTVEYPGNEGGRGGNPATAFGAGSARGGKAQTRGRKFGGVT
jgi:hypothetical protein